jgi:aconitase B
VTRVTTDATDDTGSVVLLLRAVVLAVADLATVLASLVLVVSEGTVEGGELSELVTLEFVLTFRNGCSLNLLVKALQRVGIHLQSR